MIDLRLGRWQDVLADVGEVDAVITDPPYSDRVHEKMIHNERYDGSAGADIVSLKGVSYQSITAQDKKDLTLLVNKRCRGWSCFLTDDALFYDLRSMLDRYTFQPLPCVIKGMTVRLGGDGPSSWTIWLGVSRPSHKPYLAWGTLPGCYVGPSEKSSIVGGSKPLWLMRAIIRDYTRPGDLVCDPCAGGCTTGIAAAIEGRRFVGAEMDPETFEKAMKRIRAGYTPDMFPGKAKRRIEAGYTPLLPGFAV